MRAPVLAAITLDQTGGGVAAVAGLLWRVIRDRWSDGARLIELFAHENRTPTFREKIRFSWSLARAQATRSTDWVLFSHLGLAQVQSAIPRPLRCGYAVFLHGVEVWQPLTPIERRVLARADLRLANSSYTASRVMQMHADVGPVEACPLALVPSTPSIGFEIDGGSLPVFGDHAVLIVGRMLESERYKGHDELIDAWPHVVARVPDAKLIIVGDGDGTARLKHRAAASRARDSIVFTGFVTRPTLNAFYQRAALFALPSRGEGFGLVYLEAMAHRLPCVGSIHDAASDVIIDGVTGRLVNQDDVRGLAEALIALLVDMPKRRAMGDAGYRRLMREFTFECFSERLLQILDRRSVVAPLAETAD